MTNNVIHVHVLHVVYIPHHTYKCSFDHDGLGRYGDPINPDGDLVAMDTVRNVVKEGGVLFLTVPIGIAWVCCHDSH